MACENELRYAFEAARGEGIRDHVDNLRDFNDVLDPTVTIESKRKAIERLRQNGFERTADALTEWLKCVGGA